MEAKKIDASLLPDSVADKLCDGDLIKVRSSLREVLTQNPTYCGSCERGIVSSHIKKSKQIIANLYGISYTEQFEPESEATNRTEAYHWLGSVSFHEGCYDARFGTPDVVEITAIDERLKSIEAFEFSGLDTTPASS